eukprot:TRINITY_DN2358_c0_g1_i1.p1 TRINITY_DN2358_c0_g1~~TRINITY_DN2358_c0_g1_i1.p1  ORF type:complete len:137 (+),score=11.56 TRINITY_DN2358_c0_g1_i1:73-483(+)
MRTIKLASIGGFVVAPALHFWYGPGLSFCVNRLVPRIIPGSKEFVSTRFGGAFVGMLIDQLTFSFLCNGGVIFGMEYLSRWDVKKAYDSMTSKLWETQLANWKVITISCSLCQLYWILLEYLPELDFKSWNPKVSH